MVGLYGLETVRGGERVDHPDAPQWRAVVAEVVALAERTGPEGLHVESKDLSLTLHYRQHPELAERVGRARRRSWPGRPGCGSTRRR